MSKSVSNVTRKFKNLSASKIAQLKTEKIKQRTFNKMQWSVKAYNQWRTERLSDPSNFDVKIFESDLEQLMMLTKANLCYSLCIFIAEVTKVKDGTDYPGKTLYEMIT